MGKFDDLSDLDFEELVADLATAEYKLSFRAGPRGQDNGVDVLAVDGRGRKHVIQCKHFKDSSNSKLRTAAKAEAKTLADSGLEYASYRFATSRRLTHRFREELAEILSPWACSVDAILGDGELRSLLRRHPEVEGSHVKLWLAGAGPLQALLNAAAFERSAALLEETRSALPRYVQTAAFFEARDILREESVCVIAGTAGVGKTTLARLLMLDGMEEGFTPYEIAPGGLKDTWSLLSLDERQVFYFDDFLGQTALHESRHHDADLLRLMRRIARDPQRRLVLATREYILRQAKLLSETLNRDTEDSQNFLLTIDHYSRQEKARIFYNHIYFSDQVDEVARQSLLADRSYLAIIDHPNYNPRLIEWITGFSGHGLTDQDKQGYGEYCLAVLRNPGMLWAHAFDRGLDDAQRALLVAMLGLPRRISDQDAERSFEAACAARGLATTEHRYLRSLGALDDSFVSSEADPIGQLSIGFINPSLVDFLRQYLVGSRPDAELAVRSACFFEQVLWLWHTLAGKQDAPPAAFASLFSDAFERTLTTKPPQGAHIWLRNGHLVRSPAALLQARLAELVSLGPLAHLSAAATPWLKREGERWLTHVVEQSQPFDPSVPAIASSLVEADALNAASTLGALKKVAIAMSSDLHYWEFIAALKTSFPNSYDADEWSRLRGSFEQYLGYALEDPVGFLETSEEVISLEGLASTFGAPAAEDLFGEARQELEELEAEHEGPDDDYDDYGGSRSLADFGDSDADIDAMFERFGS